jgi:hypothetical protein
MRDATARSDEIHFALECGSEVSLHNRRDGIPFVRLDRVPRKRIWCAVVMEAKKQITASVVGECCDGTRKVSLNHTIIRDIDPVFLPA